MIGILHPGAMGISIAAAARQAGQGVAWLPAGRSTATRERAEAHGLVPAESLGALCRDCDVILSVCPPHAAVDVAGAVAAEGFAGVYVDGNAISPSRTLRVANIVSAAGAAYVDGGIVGPPAWKPGTCLYVSGARAREVLPLFAGSPLEVQDLGPEPTRASALKMCYAARTKGTAALLAAIFAAAERLGVSEPLVDRLAGEDPAIPDGIEARVRAAAPKAWRWIDEMEEIAETLRDAGTEGGFHDAAADVFRRLAGYKDAAPPPELDEILASLVAEDSRS